MMTDTITLISSDGGTSAEFVPEANMLCCSLRCAGAEMLDQGRGVDAYAQRGKTMGIPLLHPWANRLAGFDYSVAGRRVDLRDDDERVTQDPNGLPIHGVLPGLLRWEAQTAGDRLQARLSWTGETLLQFFPFAHELRMSAVLGDGELTIETVLAASGEDRVPVSFGYHPYLRLASPREQWSVTLGASHRLLLDERMIPTGEREPVGERTFRLEDSVGLDDGYDGVAEGARFEAACEGTSLAVHFEHGYPFAQVYAPPGRDFICFEPMTAPANALRSGTGLHVVAPGEEHRARFRITTAQAS